MEPEVLAATSFSFDEEDSIEDVFSDEITADEDEFTAMDRKALVAAVKTAGIKGLKSLSTEDEIRTALRAAALAA